MHTSQFRVRIYDIDVFGELRSSVLLRFLWQTASDASSAAGFDLAWYERAGTLWVIRRTGIELLAPAVYDDELAIRTWVADIRRVRSQREYEIVRPRDDTPIARATTDWVYVDLTRGALVQPPPAMQQGFMPDGVVSRPRRPSAAAAPPAGCWHSTRRVELFDLDTVAHVNNAQYPIFVEQALWDALAAHDWHVNPTARDPRLRLRSHDLEYFESARYGDTLDVALWVSALGDDGFTTECQLERDGARSLHARSTWRWSAGQLPAELRDVAAALRAPDGAGSA
jgi:acyl-CoA thioester hydrolase